MCGGTTRSTGARSRARGVLARGCRGDRLGRARPTRMLDDSRAPFYRWFAGGRLNTCYNALDRHVERGRGDQPRPDLRQAGHRAEAHLHATGAPRRGGDVRRRAAHERASSSGDRVIIYMPMVPEALVAMLACARLGAVHSVVFGGFASDELATRIDDAAAEGDRHRLVRDRGRPRGRLQAAARRGDRPARPQAGALRDRSSGRSSRRSSSPGATSTGPRRGRRRGAGGLRLGRRRPTRSTSSTPPARPGSPRGSSATPAATRSRSSGRCRNIYDVKPGEVYWAASDIGWVVGHSYIVYAPLLHGCTTVLYEGKPVGTPDAGAFWRVIAEHGVDDAVHRADGVPRDQAGGSGAASTSRRYDLVGSARCSSPASAATRRRSQWAEREARRAGDRPLVADGDRAGRSSRTAGDRAAAGQAPARRRGRCPGWDVRVLDESGAGGRRRRDRRHRREAAAAAGRLPDAVERGASASARPTSPRSPATTRPPTPASSTRTATFRHGPRPTTSSTSPATASPPARWRRCWRPTRRGRVRGDRRRRRR